MDSRADIYTFERALEEARSTQIKSLDSMHGSKSSRAGHIESGLVANPPQQGKTAESESSLVEGVDLDSDMVSYLGRYCTLSLQAER